MAMNVGDNGSDEPEVMMDINTTPLIDVMLVLIIMLIITIPVQLHAVNLDLPGATAPPASREPTVVTIDVDFDGTILWDGVVLAGRSELEARLAKVAAQLDQDEVHIRPNQLVDYAAVAAVLAAAQRVGVTKMGIAGSTTLSE